jgi:hypothetical protein
VVIWRFQVEIVTNCVAEGSGLVGIVWELACKITYCCMLRMSNKQSLNNTESNLLIDACHENSLFFTSWKKYWPIMLIYIKTNIRKEKWWNFSIFKFAKFYKRDWGDLQKTTHVWLQRWRPRCHSRLYRVLCSGFNTD